MHNRTSGHPFFFRTIKDRSRCALSPKVKEEQRPSAPVAIADPRVGDFLAEVTSGRSLLVADWSLKRLSARKRAGVSGETGFSASWSRPQKQFFLLFPFLFRDAAWTWANRNVGKGLDSSVFSFDIYAQIHPRTADITDSQRAKEHQGGVAMGKSSRKPKRCSRISNSGNLRTRR